MLNTTNKGLSWGHVRAHRMWIENDIEVQIRDVKEGTLCAKAVRLTAIIIAVLLVLTGTGLFPSFPLTGVTFGYVGASLIGLGFATALVVLGLEGLIKHCIISSKRSQIKDLEKAIPEDKKNKKLLGLEEMKVLHVLKKYRSQSALVLASHEALFKQLNSEQLEFVKKS